MSAVHRGAVHAHGHLVLHAVEPQGLVVQVTVDLTGHGLSLLEGLAGVLQVSVRYGPVLPEGLSADGAPGVDLPGPVPAAPAERVGAGQQHGVSEDALTHGAGQLQAKGLGSLDIYVHVHASGNSRGSMTAKGKNFRLN